MESLGSFLHNGSVSRVVAFASAAAAGAIVAYFVTEAGKYQRFHQTVLPQQTAVSKDKIVIVTGGSRGIGAAVCRVLGRQGYNVVVNYTSNRSKAELVMSDINEAGGSAIMVQADVSNYGDVEHLFEEAANGFGLGKRVTHLVNNAGIIGDKWDERSLLGVEVHELQENLQRVLNTNLFGALFCCREAMQHMSPKNGGQGGAIVNVSSGSAYLGGPMPYGISKAALNSLQAGLVVDCAALDIRINSVSPGMTRTEMVPDSLLDTVKHTIPMKRGGEPKEIADVVAFLLSEEASYCTGANIRVAGGKRMGCYQ
eukprot:m.465369 g.465369  ORF g.465369 m.465369 type:complete len:312 (-) comp21628_c0_seq6:1392-2327(-)